MALRSRNILTTLAAMTHHHQQQHQHDPEHAAPAAVTPTQLQTPKSRVSRPPPTSHQSGTRAAAKDVCGGGVPITLLPTAGLSARYNRMSGAIDTLISPSDMQKCVAGRTAATHAFVLYQLNYRRHGSHSQRKRRRLPRDRYLRYLDIYIPNVHNTTKIVDMINDRCVKFPDLLMRFNEDIDEMDDCRDVDSDADNADAADRVVDRP